MTIKKYLILTSILCSLILAQQAMGQSEDGIHFTPQELQIWRQRAESGPYRVTGDVSANSPGDWTRIINNANQFLQNPSKDRYHGGDGTFKTEPHGNHVNMRDAAFVYLVKRDKKYLDAVRKELLAQIAVPAMDVTKWGLVGDTHRFTAAEWFVRLLFTYDYIKDGLTSSERQKLDQYFRNVGRFFANNINHYHEMLFPNRLKGDYSVRGRDAESGSMRNQYTHTNKDGSKGHKLSFLSSWYNNRKSSMMRAVGLIGVFLNDQDLIKHTKIYIKEMLMFSTYPDGTMGEYNRNGNYGNPQAGMIYSGINIQMAVEIADALARKGDNELYDYKTSAGLWGTEGGSKSIRLIVKNFYDQVSYKVERYTGGVDVRNRIDIENEFGGNYGVEKWVHDIWFAMGNVYWKDDYFKSVYLRKVGPAYPDKNLAGCGSVSWPWGGAGAVYPGVLFMFGQMEGKVWPYGGSSSTACDKAPAKPTIQVSGNTVICEGEQVELAAPAGFTAYEWNSNGNTQKIKAVKAGEYRVKVKDKEGCWSEYSEPVNIANKDVAGVLEIKVTGETEICENETVILEAMGDYKDFLWSNGEKGRQITVNKGGTYTVQAQVCPNSWSNPSAPVELVVHELPQTAAIINKNDTLIAEMFDGSKHDYQWQLNGRPILGANGQTYVPVKKGEYSTLTTNKAGCTARSRNQMLVDPAIDIVEVYPNPNNGRFSLEIQKPLSKDYQIVVFDSTNRAVFEQESESFNSSLSSDIDLSQFGKGMYFVKVFAEDRVIVKKVLVR